MARELRQLRERAGMTLDVAARQLDMSKSNLSRIETAQIGIKPRDVRAALALYEVTGSDAEALIEIARGAQQRGWWQNYSDVLPEWFEFYVGLEAEAATLRTYEAESVPGLLQTEAYAREIFRRTAGEDGLERKVAARLRRQEVLRRADRRRVVLATALAETSLTVPGVRIVVDAGLSRVPRIDLARGLGALVTVPVSRAAATQRAGRAGREAPGYVYRCWSAATHERLPARAEPEIATADLTGFALELAAWG
ncbi:Scr1 family TA system antitoxin-like transcriptional regulator, partial [Micromonospora sp. M51]|uniref:helix-turn-helix domain-containing protein n=1 Tax=Micromonospora sp. M51 TaxID=2824889 RepID=UPI0028125A88